MAFSVSQSATSVREHECKKSYGRKSFAKIMLILLGLCLKATISSVSDHAQKDVRQASESNSSFSYTTSYLQKHHTNIVMSYGVMFELEVKHPNTLIQINSLDVFTTANSFIDIEVWSINGTYTNLKVTDRLDLSEWTKLCCNIPILGRGRYIPTSIPSDIFQPIFYAVDERALDVTLTLYITMKSKEMISHVINEERNYKKSLLLTNKTTTNLAEEYINIKLGTTIDQDIFGRKISNIGRTFWNGAIYFNATEIGHEKNSILRSQSLKNPTDIASFHPIHHLLISDRRLETCRMVQQIQTPILGSTESFGIMFDVFLSQNVILETLEFRTKKERGTPMYYTVYAKLGSHEGFETDEKKWTKLSDGFILSAGWNGLTGIPNDEFTQINMESGKKYALYIATNSSDILYGKGKEVGQTITIDDNMQIFEGIGMAQFPPFGDKMFSPRAFQGRLHYSLEKECREIPKGSNTRLTRRPTMSPTIAPTPCKSNFSTKTKFEGRKASFGIMFDTRSKEDNLIIEGFSVRSGKEAGARLKYIVYSKKKSYHQFETNSTEWSKIAEGFTTSGGPSALTILPIARSDRVSVEPSRTRAFYLTFDTPDLIYSIGEDEGKLYTSDDNIQIFEGVAMAEFPPFGFSYKSPRQFEGIIQYSVEEECFHSMSIQPTLTPSTRMSAFPTLVSSTEPSKKSSTRPSTRPNQQFTMSPSMHPTLTPLSRTSDPSTQFNSNTVKQQNTLLPSMLPSRMREGTIIPSGSRSDSLIHPTLFRTNAPFILNVTTNSMKMESYPNGSKIPSTLPTHNLSLPNRTTSCRNIKSIKSKLNGTYTSYGTMFEVRTINKPLSIETFGFHSKQNRGFPLNYTLFYKPGSYHRYETNGTSWKKVSEGLIESEGQKQFTIIPPKDFVPILMLINSTHSFYLISNISAVIHYTGLDQGIANDDIEIMEGVSIEGYPPFQSKISSPRQWEGIFLYSSDAACINWPLELKNRTTSLALPSGKPVLMPESNLNSWEPNNQIHSNTSAEYYLPSRFEPSQETNHRINSIHTDFTDLSYGNFTNDERGINTSQLDFITTSVILIFQIKDTFANELQLNHTLVKIHEYIEQILLELFNSNSLLRRYSEEFSMHLTSLTTNLTYEENDKLSHCANFLQNETCLIVETIIDVVHSKTIISDQVWFLILSHIEKSVAELEPLMIVKYIGPHTETIYIEVILKGSKLNSTWFENDKIDIIANVFKSTIDQKLSSIESIYDIQVINVEASQEPIFENKLSQGIQFEGTQAIKRHRAHLTESISLYVNIKIEYKGLPLDSLDDLVLEAIKKFNNDILLAVKKNTHGFELIENLEIYGYNGRINNSSGSDKSRNATWITVSNSSGFDSSKNTTSAISGISRTKDSIWNFNVLYIAAPSTLLLSLIFRVIWKRKKAEIMEAPEAKLSRRSSWISKEIWSRRDIEDVENYNKKFSRKLRFPSAKSRS